ncbi:glycine-rich RNA-binding protein 3, mitochondrial-like isoform X1 [Mercurialis annua]|uniref:glycine-rich RNA-binding protein 3, mitochondrial-like isoform X1 n=1 Tax=Mercurialis annua TaxID=3986 RepID=UPI00215F0B34|nr:glycine-rich RNA-binding protein 3, mitochondrial-like isoform X1 [Mercurialis annua]XP_050225070.1 glycine-rich RNA-binding protein 3, mitochondrial-like isoform X1 [Mercurialis annua]
MAILGKLGNIMRQTFSKQIINELYASSTRPSLCRPVRCMSSTKVFVGGISGKTNGDDLKKAFSKYGSVVEARVITQRETGKSKGFGFVTFGDSESAANAIDSLNGKNLHIGCVRVCYATDKAPGTVRGHGRGGYSSGKDNAGDLAKQGVTASVPNSITKKCIPPLKPK